MSLLFMFFEFRGSPAVRDSWRVAASYAVARLRAASYGVDSMAPSRATFFTLADVSMFQLGL